MKGYRPILLYLNDIFSLVEIGVPLFAAISVRFLKFLHLLSASDLQFNIILV